MRKSRFGLGVLVALACGWIAAEAIAIELDPATVLYMPFEEGSGAKTADLSGKNNHGKLQGGAKWVTGKFGGGLEFNGTDSMVEIASANTLQAEDSPFTIAFWVKASPDSAQWARVVDKFYGTGYNVGRRGGDLVMGAEWAGSANSFATVSVVFDNKWHHIALTRELIVAGKIQLNALVLYMDGKEESQGAGGAAVQHNKDTTPVRIGAGDECCDEGGNAAYWLSGIVDDVLIIKKSLSVAEITALMNESVSLAVQPGGKLAASWGHLKRP